MLTQLTDERRESLRTRLYEWRKAGKLLPLRRGMYAIAEPYRQTPVDPAHLSNLLYTPSYLSLQWALSYHGLIPEKTVAYTSVTPRVPRTFTNALGTFSYRNIKQAAFFGSRAVEIGNTRVLLAEPEKAMLDLWHLGRGSWTMERMREMRFQNTEQVNPGRLADYAAKFDSPRLRQAVEGWLELAAEEQGGSVEL